MKILFINASPRGEAGSCSALILKDLRSYLAEGAFPGIGESELITLSRHPDEGDHWEALEASDVWILACPLYVDSLPGHMTRWLKDYEDYRRSRGGRAAPAVYGIVNCGFPEARQNRDALKILEIFCARNGLEWRFGIGLGMGEAYRGMSSMPLKASAKAEIRRAFEVLAGDLAGLKRRGGEAAEGQENLFASVRFPRFLYRLVGSLQWKSQARKNGLKSGDLYRAPLKDAEGA